MAHLVQTHNVPRHTSSGCPHPGAARTFEAPNRLTGHAGASSLSHFRFEPVYRPPLFFTGDICSFGACQRARVTIRAHQLLFPTEKWVMAQSLPPHCVPCHISPGSRVRHPRGLVHHVKPRYAERFCSLLKSRPSRNRHGTFFDG